MKYRVLIFGILLILISSLACPKAHALVLQNTDVPSSRGQHAMVYDSHNEVSVLFGGMSSDGGLHAVDDTWLYSYSTNTWTELTLTVNPPARSSHSMVYCNETNEIILFGGGSLSDTWSFDCATQTWSEVTTASNPGVHWCHAMAYDPTEQVVILFGGFSGEGYEGDDTWEFNCITREWTELNPATIPLARYGHVMVYDEVINQIVLSCGNTAFEGHQDDTWRYDTASNSWTEISTSGTPGRLKWPGMVYDSVNHRSILFGGQVEDDPIDRTMIFNAESETWVSANPETAPQSRITPGLSFDKGEEVVVLFGGMGPDYGQLGDTWCYSFEDNVWMDMSSLPSSPGATSDTSPTSPTELEIPLLWIGIPVSIAIVAMVFYVVWKRK